MAMRVCRATSLTQAQPGSSSPTKPLRSSAFSACFLAVAIRRNFTSFASKMPVKQKPLHAGLFTARDIERFHESYDKLALDACWEWQRALTKRGYAMFTTGHFRDGSRVQYTASRVSYWLDKRTDPGPLFVCHTCDNPTCVNPSHLFVGTNADNLSDMVKKGRSARPVSVRKINYATARAIREDTRNGQTLCKVYGLAKSTISDIRTGKTWREDGFWTHIVAEPNFTGYAR